MSNKRSRMKYYLTLVLCILLPLLVGSFGGIATASNIPNWFMYLNKPWFNPPSYLFGPVWTVLYILLGISFFMILQAPKSSNKQKAVLVFSIQLFLNFIWSFIFFKFHLLGIAAIEICLMWISIVIMILAFHKINKIAAFLQFPYLLWVSFATVLNISIWYLN